jgi:uncharacterized protein
MIPPAEISKLAHRLGLGDKTIEKDYVLTWVLFAMAESSLREWLVFKGGTAIKKMFVPDYRFSEDLDFTLLDPGRTNAELQTAAEGLFPWLAREANLALAMEKVDVHPSTGNPTIYLNYVGPLQAALTSRSLKVDFSRDETLAFPAEARQVLSGYSDCQARQAVLTVYSMKEILIEKLRSLLTRTEPRDLYDIHYILTNQMIDVEKVSFHAAPKFEAKGLVVGDLRTVLERRRATFQQLWARRLNGQMPDIPDLEMVIRETNRILQRYF